MSAQAAAHHLAKLGWTTDQVGLVITATKASPEESHTIIIMPDSIFLRYRRDGEDAVTVELTGEVIDAVVALSEHIDDQARKESE